jgi:hypothetical protein
MKALLFFLHRKFLNRYHAGRIVSMLNWLRTAQTMDFCTEYNISITFIIFLKKKRVILIARFAHYPVIIVSGGSGCVTRPAAQVRQHPFELLA